MKQLQVLIILVLVLIAGVASYWVFNNSKSTIVLETGTLYPEDFNQISAFNLITNKDEIYSLNSFKNKSTLLLFGFTHCPDVCPASLVTLQQIERQVKQSLPQQDMDYVFVSVDPKRDTPEKIHEYATYFNPDFKGVTGDTTEINKLTRSLAAFYRVPDDSDPTNNYLVEHSASIYLIGSDARPKALFSYPHDAAKIAEDIIKFHQS